MYKEFDPSSGAPEDPLDEERPGGIWAPNQVVISKPDVGIAICGLKYVHITPLLVLGGFVSCGSFA
jgi:hypothetical protein